MKDEHGVLTDDPENCAELLNSFVSSQFQDGFSALGFRGAVTRTVCPDISVDGVGKLIRDLPNGKSPGPDTIRKPDMLIDLTNTAGCPTYFLSIPEFEKAAQAMETRICHSYS